MSQAFIPMYDKLSDEERIAKGLPKGKYVKRVRDGVILTAQGRVVENTSSPFTLTSLTDLPRKAGEESFVVTHSNNRMSIEFARYDIEAFKFLLKCKELPEKEVNYDWRTDRYTIRTPSRFAGVLGFEVPESKALGSWKPSTHLYESQRHIVGAFLECENFACFADCGRGKTSIITESALAITQEDHDSKSLIMTPLNVIPEFLSERDRFYSGLELTVLKSRVAIAEWCENKQPGIAITNTEKMAGGQVPEFRNLKGFFLDEASILKTIGGTIKWNILHSTRSVPRKLSATATPAPNEVWEYASQAGFLGKLKDKDPEFWGHFTFDEKSRGWEIKAHARAAFYRHLASWSIYLRNPAAYGWHDPCPPVPEPEWIEHPIDPTTEQLTFAKDLLSSANRGLLVDVASLDMKLRLQLSQVAKGFNYQTKRRYASLKPSNVARIAAEEVQAGRQTVIWTVFDEEADLVCAELSALGMPYGSIQGWDDPEKRLETINAFKSGECRLLITKPTLLAFGVNLQACGAMVFSGFTDSAEQVYQAIRRAVRTWQTQSVRLHWPFIPELEGQLFTNIQRKLARFETDCAEMERAYASVLRRAA